MASTSTSSNKSPVVTNLARTGSFQSLKTLPAKRKRHRTKAKRSYIISLIEKSLIRETNWGTVTCGFTAITELCRRLELELDGISQDNLISGINQSYLLELSEDKRMLKLTEDQSKLEETKVFVDHIPPSMTVDRLESVLSVYGTVLDVRIHGDKHLAYAFVQFAQPTCAQKAVSSGTKVPYSAPPCTSQETEDKINETIEKVIKNDMTPEPEVDSEVGPETEGTLPPNNNKEVVSNGNVKKKKKNRARKTYRKKKESDLRKVMDRKVRTHMVVLPFNHWLSLKQSYKKEQKRNMGQLKKHLQESLQKFTVPMPPIDCNMRGRNKIMKKVQLLHEMPIKQASKNEDIKMVENTTLNDS